MERLEDRALLTVNLLGSYTGLGENGFVPPDTCGAAGPTSYVETQNQDVAIFTPKATGTTSVTSSLSTFWFTQGGLARASSTSGLSDPIVVWDDQVNRFIIGDQDVDNTNHKDTFDIAVSRSASPATLTTADWYFYQVTTTETGRNADYPGNFGYNRDAFVFTLNQNQAVSGAGSAVQICSISINDLIAGNPITPFLNDINGFSIRPTVMHDSVAGGPMWLTESTAGDGNTINVIRMTNVLSNAPTFTTTTLNVNAYKSVVRPLQPDGTGLAPASGNGALWTHILKAGEYNNSIVACDQISVSSTEDDARWYRIDVSGATPTLADQGNVSAGDNTYVVFPSIDINARGDIGMTYLQSGTGSNQYMSTYITGRTAGDTAGTMETPVLVKAGVANNTDGREGDLSGISVDSTPLTVAAPADQNAAEGASASINVGDFTDPEGNFWAANEWADKGGLYNTVIGQFTLGTKGPWSVDVDWGDGTAHDTFNVATAGSLGTRAHTYGEEGTKTVTVKVTDPSDNHSDTKTFEVTVSDPAVAQATSVPLSPVEGAAFGPTALATFTDPGGAEPNPADPTGTHYTVASIDWGDGTPLDTTTGAIGFAGTPGSKTDPFTVTGSHTYGEEGSYTIHVKIDHEGVITTLTDTADVSDPQVVATGVPVYATACKPLTGVPLAAFTDPGGAEPNPSDPTPGVASHYTVASIDWGDGTPLDTTTGAIGFAGTPGSETDPFTVTGSHTYATEGSYTITVVIDHEGVKTTVTAPAVVKDKLGLLLLDPAGGQSLAVTGNGRVAVTGDCGAAVVNSTAADAAFVTGNGVVTAEDFDVTGGVVTRGHGAVPSPVGQEAPTPDPLGLGLPSPLPAPPAGNTATLLHPGTYVGGLHISGKSAVTLAPGVYVMQGGGFGVDGQASVTGNGVVIVNIPGGPGDTISVSGQASVSLSAPTGGTYKGVAVVQLAPNPVQFSGQANVTIAGVFYTPGAPVSITGNAVVTVNPGAGTASLPPIDAALIAFDLKVSGNGVLTINPDGAPAAPAPLGAAPAVQAAAINSLVSGGGTGLAAALPDQEAMNEVVMSLAGTPDLFTGVNGGKKKTS